MIVLTRSSCAYCREPIAADIDVQSTLDWGHRGDYGCGAHPLNDDEGTHGHQPIGRDAVTLTEEVRAMFNEGLRGRPYVRAALDLARRLNLR